MMPRAAAPTEAAVDPEVEVGPAAEDATPSLPIPAAVHDILADKPTAFVTTMRPDGRMSTTPMAVVFDGERLRLSTTKDRRKHRNLRLDDRITVCVPHRNNPNRYVEVRGRAVLDDDVDRSFIDSIAQAYMGVERYPFDRPDAERVTITVVAEHVSAPGIPLADAPPQARDGAAGENDPPDP
jgi:PPOX class probable F420-dependent enzyme